MLNVDMDIGAHRWFEELTKSHLGEVTVGLWQASDIVGELAHRKAIRDLFFPGAIIEVSELRALVMRTSDSTDSQLSSSIRIASSRRGMTRLKAR